MLLDRRAAEAQLHWLAYHVPPDQPGLPEGASHTGADFLVEGKNSKLKPGYLGAAPPSGDSAHRYHFQLFALDLAPGLGAGAGRSRLINALRGHVIAFGELVGTYQRLSDR